MPGLLLAVYPRAGQGSYRGGSAALGAALRLLYVRHYNEHRPHGGLDQQAPGTLGLVADPIDEPDPVRLRGDEILGGLINQHRLVA